MNNPIFAPSLRSIELRFSLGLSGTTPMTFNQVFSFAHQETPNDGSCPFGGANNVGMNINGCADRMTFGSPATSSPFTFMGESFFLNIIGFSADGGASTTPDLLTRESFTTSADLFGNLVRVDPFITNTVPEPSTYVLMAIGLAAVGVAARRHRAPRPVA